MNFIELKTGAWRGDRTIQLEIPDNWDITFHKGNPYPPLTDSEIQNQLLNPIANQPLIEMAKNKKLALIVIDDIMRPTPTAKILPFVISQLELGGISKEAIRIIIACGSHPKPLPDDLELKLGKKVLDEIKVEIHNDQSNLVFLGNSNQGTPIYVNELATQADLKIGISGVYPHPSAGFSGGVKIVVPGICGKQTTTHLRTLVAAGRPGSLKNSFRTELEAIAEKIGLDFSINISITPDREISGLFAGDKLKSHDEAVKYVRKQYGVKSFSKADVVISNCYPMDGSYYFFERGYWPLVSARKDSTQILIADGSMTNSLYPFKIFEQSKSNRFGQIMNIGSQLMKSIYNPFKTVRQVKEILFLRKLKFNIFTTGNSDIDELKKQFPNALVTNDWQVILDQVKKDRDKIKVAVYNYAGITFPT